MLGVDPGTIAVGYGALVIAPREFRLFACGVIRPPRRAAPAVRLAHIRAEIDALLGRFRPEYVAVEKAFAARNVQSALRIGEGRGVILSCAAAAESEVVEITPAEAKKAVVGNGQASKEQVAQMVATIVGRAEVAELDADATDAIAIAYAHARKLSGMQLRASRPPGRSRIGDGRR